MDGKQQRALIGPVAVVISPLMNSFHQLLTQGLTGPAEPSEVPTWVRSNEVPDFLVAVPALSSPSSFAFDIVRNLRDLGTHVMIVAGIGTWLGEPSTHDVIGVVGDHINLTGENPLIGRSDSEGSPRFVDMSVAYSERLIELAELSAAERGRVARRVILAECRPECAGGAEEARWANRLGAEAIGFGIAPFAIAATSQGIETLAFFGAADADWLRTSGRDRAAPGGPRPLAEIVLSCIRRIPVPLES